MHCHVSHSERACTAAAAWWHLCQSNPLALDKKHQEPSAQRATASLLTYILYVELSRLVTVCNSQGPSSTRHGSNCRSLGAHRAPQALRLAAGNVARSAMLCATQWGHAGGVIECWTTACASMACSTLGMALQDHRNMLMQQQQPSSKHECVDSVQDFARHKRSR